MSQGGQHNDQGSSKSSQLSQTNASNPYSDGSQNANLEYYFECLEPGAILKTWRAKEYKNVFHTLTQPMDLKFKMDAEGDIWVDTFGSKGTLAASSAAESAYDYKKRNSNVATLRLRKLAVKHKAALVKMGQRAQNQDEV